MRTNSLFHFIKQTAWLVAGLLSLTGCASTNSNFTCPMTPGHFCSSLDDVNQMVDQGRVGGKNTAAPNNTSVNSSLAAADVAGYPMGAMQPGDPLRYGESVQRIWVAPYEDKDGNYHQASTLYSIVRPGHWIGNPPRATDDLDD